MEFNTLRRFPRVSVDLAVTCKVAGKNRHCRLAELGGNGFLLNISDDLAPGTELDVKFRPRKRHPSISARVQVRYQVPAGGYGVEFTAISPDDRQILLRFVLSRLREKRRYPRRPFVVQVVHAKEHFLTYSRNISVRGMYLGTNDPLAAGAIAILRFPLDDGEPTIHATGEVRYFAKGHGMGLMFIELKPEDQSRFDFYVNKGESSMFWPG
jgi:hypothetical protein